jgi:4-methylaminobutanoate oxidase (formaldehyde-forming)
MVTHFHTSPTIMRMRAYSIRLYRSLQTEPGSAEHWHEVGSLGSRRAGTSGSSSSGGGDGAGARLDVDTISPAEALRLFPLMSPDDLHGAMYLPGDGWIDRAGPRRSRAARADARGDRRDRRARDGHRQRDGAVAAVVTDRGRVRAEIVVNAAGMWGGRWRRWRE